MNKVYYCNYYERRRIYLSVENCSDNFVRCTCILKNIRKRGYKNLMCRNTRYERRARTSKVTVPTEDSKDKVLVENGPGQCVQVPERSRRANRTAVARTQTAGTVVAWTIEEATSCKKKLQVVRKLKLKQYKN
jgi:hypothetical protein